MSGNLQRQLDEQRERAAARRPPEVTATIAGAIHSLREAGIAERALGVGAQAPGFALPNAHGSHVRLGELLGRGPVVLAFYRGVWWPYCNLQLQAYQALLPELRARGASLAAVSPQLPDGSLSMAEKHALEFEVLSDVGNAVAREYGLVWRLPADLREVYEKALKILLPQYNGDDSWELPIPATFVLDRTGTVRFSFVEPDHTRRAEPADILAALGEAAP